MLDEAGQNYLEILGYIFNHVSDNPLTHCQEIIHKIFRTLDENDLSRDEKNVALNPLYKKLSSVEILLKFYLKLHSETTASFEKLNVTAFLKIILEFAQNSLYSEELGDENLQIKIFEIISNLCKIEFLCSTQKDHDAFIEFYFKNIITASENQRERYFQTLFRVKFIHTLYNLWLNFSENEEKQDIIRDFNERLFELNPGVNEMEVFLNLLYNSADEKLINISFQLIIQYFKCIKGKNLVQVIWDKISFTLDEHLEKNIDLERTIVLLCCLLESRLFDSVSNKDKDVFFIFDSSGFWRLIQKAVIHENSSVRKRGIFLFKKVLKVIETSSNSFLTQDENMGHSPESSVLQKVVSKTKFYIEIITILEFLDEQQFHIVEPAFEKINSFFKKLATAIKLEKFMKSMFPWVVVILEKAFKHESTQVIKLALHSLVKLPRIYFADEPTLTNISRILIPTLNNISLYYTDGMAISEKLIELFTAVSSYKFEVFFCLFTKDLCKCVWSPEALYFISYALAKIKFCVWKEEEISEINKFVSKTFHTYNKTIKLAIQTQFMHSVINLTATEYAPFEKIILLLSNFSTAGLFKNNPTALKKIINWLNVEFSQVEAEWLLDKLKRDQLPIEFKEQTIGFMYFLFYYTYGSGNTDAGSTPSECFVLKYLCETFATFKNLNTRLYCNESLCHKNLLIVYYTIKEAYINSCNIESSNENKLLKLLLPFFKDLKLYIETQLKLCTGLQNFDNCQVMIKVYKWSLKIEHLLINASDSLVYVKILLSELTPYFKFESSMPFMQVYIGMKIIGILINQFDANLDLFEINNLIEYLGKYVNDPLEKKTLYSRDIEVLWGKLNAKYLKAKWILFEILERKGKFYNDEKKNIFELCLKGVNVGGYGVLCPIMKIMQRIIPFCNCYETVEQFIGLLWRSINERRKTKKFKIFVQLFIEMLFQRNFFCELEFSKKLLFEYSNLLFEDSSILVINILMEHMDVEWSEECILFSNMISKGLTYGPVLRKDEKLVRKIISTIKSENTCPVIDDISSNEVRAKSIKKFSEANELVRGYVIKSLLKMFTEVGANKNRYFGDSYIHKVKLRVMQALLTSGDFKSQYILDFVWNSIEHDNSQPSVRYLQEWYLILGNNSHDRAKLKLQSAEKPKFLCSLISVLYHTYRKGDSSIFYCLFELCLNQNFEVRLYSQVALNKLFKSFEGYPKHYPTGHSFGYNYSKFGEPDPQFKLIRQVIQGIASRNSEKLEKHFFFTVFNPKKHLTLETIYIDLPRLTNVEPEEWISIDYFKNLDIPSVLCGTENTDSLLRSLVYEPWIAKNYNGEMRLAENIEINELHLNYQKKIVPDCDVTFPTDRRNHTSNTKGDLIVVGTLIDRIPNLGGLARTCETFGVSEFVINSLKHIQNKEFTSLSVTAEKWINIKEVKHQNLLNYIIEMKKSGYSIIGAEQTTQSEPLTTVKLPKKCVLLLGNEKKGIPSDLLPFLDVCVEIPQIGIVRSLNVHVSGALFIWEFAKQNYFS